MSAPDKCPVCAGEVVQRGKSVSYYACGNMIFDFACQPEQSVCGNAERLAIERADEIELLRARVAELESELKTKQGE